MLQAGPLLSSLVRFEEWSAATPHVPDVPILILLLCGILLCLLLDGAAR